ncbi:hypothetical protein D3C84_951810 [compost metagenome]
MACVRGLCMRAGVGSERRAFYGCFAVLGDGVFLSVCLVCLYRIGGIDPGRGLCARGDAVLECSEILSVQTAVSALPDFGARSFRL